MYSRKRGKPANLSVCVSRRRFIEMSAGAAACAFLGGRALAAPAKPARPNIVLIVLDSLRYDRYAGKRAGIELMPRLRERASKGLEFRRAWATCSWTKPSMASVYTGLHVDAHGLRYIDASRKNFEETQTPPSPSGEGGLDVLSPSFKGMGEILREHGYGVYALQSNHVMAPQAGFDRGFREYKVKTKDLWPANKLTGDALARIEAAEEPFFLYVHYMDTHRPFNPPARYRGMLGMPSRLLPEDRAWVDERGSFYQDLVHHKLSLKEEREHPDPTEEGKEAVRVLYDGTVKYTDDELDWLLDAIEKKGDNTIVALMADHGEELWDHGSLGHGMTLYEEVNHVPLVLWGSGIPEKAVDEPVELLDLLPTFAEAAGIKPDPQWQGRSLLEQTRPACRALFSASYGGFPYAPIDLHAARQRKHKLIAPGKGEPMLFDLVADPAEKMDWAAKRPEEAERLRKLISELAQNNARINAGAAPAESIELTPEQREAIEALGYVGGA